MNPQPSCSACLGFAAKRGVVIGQEVVTEYGPGIVRAVNHDARGEVAAWVQLMEPGDVAVVPILQLVVPE